MPNKSNELPWYCGRLTLKNGSTVYIQAQADPHNVHDMLRRQCRTEHNEPGKVRRIVRRSEQLRELFEG